MGCKNPASAHVSIAVGLDQPEQPMRRQWARLQRPWKVGFDKHKQLEEHLPPHFETEFG